MSFKPDRRQLLKGAALGGPALLASASAVAAPQPPALTARSIRVADLASHFDVDPTIHNLEAGYWSIMPRVVAEAYARHTIEVNRSNSIFARNVLPGEACLANGSRDAQMAIARQVGCSPEEICVTRSGSDALQLLIANYRGIKAGDAVIYCDLDYDATIGAMEWLGTHKGARVVKFAMPEPATTANILAAYDDVLKRNPDAKLLLVTQVSNRTGLVTPVKEIVTMARARGVDTIVDAAHGIALLDFQLADLGADFVAWSVHKWTSAPLGTGAMYIRRSRLADIDIAYENHHLPADNINARLPAGTINFAALLTIPIAVDFHFAVGATAKERHMRALRDRWVDAVRDVPSVTMAVPDDPARYCAITSFRLKGMDSDDRAKAVQQRLFDKYRILTVWRTGIAKGPVIRVTPGLYSTAADVDALATALRAEHAMFG
ncbi:aminotransferase class V-fold PLP-dependent enzyme [Sphingomonas montanisoli]|uniref:Aminotransferase class V-fold PLP-dependent enzyme n=1 Tax=Sphingomonas montanisoli TaxID=2606412 RepID=A0A5D9C3D3_9SPHN|nr:aminotransferase class V-fold PLP-dependent enzyme [Sphingomonas montanisoli]TZG26046.1 aminotransferase class V-fold PLP-dependent enzyme [Sphingomonas montanisoli]